MKLNVGMDDPLYREAKAAVAQEGVRFRFRTHQAGAPMILDDAGLKEAANRAQEVHDLEKLAR